MLWMMSDYIVDKQHMKTCSLFSGNLVGDRSNCANGYGGTFPEMCVSMKSGSTKPLPDGLVNVDLEFLAIIQIWHHA